LPPVQPGFSTGLRDRAKESLHTDTIALYPSGAGLRQGRGRAEGQSGENFIGIFSTIKDKIFGKKEEPKAQVVAAAAPAVAPPVAAAAPAPLAISEVDVEASLDAMAGSDKLNWRTSIVDLMKLIGLDASYAERKELAEELGRTDYEGSADDNIWLHKQVMSELAKNGGKVPASLRD
jgi:hypothetical protein